MTNSGLQVSTEEVLLPARSESSCSLTLDSGSKLTDKDVFTSRRQRSGDALTICDSGSEVSDEGYKSSQGNVSKTEEARATPTDSLTKSNDSQGNQTPREASQHLLYIFIDFLFV